MLQLMLDAHPEICNFSEFEYAVRYANGVDFPETAEYIQLLDGDRVFRTHGFKIEPHLQYFDLVRSFLEQAAKRSGKLIVGATIHSRFDLLPRIWPNARYLHLIRDPRDVSRSCIGMGWVGNVWYGADIWIDAENRWQRLANTISSDDYIEIRFEELLADPRREIGRICQFLQLGYSVDMLGYPNHSTYSAPDPSLANQWQGKLTNREVQLVEHKCYALLQSRGYAVHSRSTPVRWYERVALSLQNRWKRWVFNINRYGLVLYFQWQAAKRLGAVRSAWARQILRRIDAIDEAHLK